MNDAYQDLKEVLAKVFGVSLGEVDAYIAARGERDRARIQRSNQRYAEALGKMTAVQAALVTTLEAAGAELQTKLWVDRTSGNIALMLVRDQVWDSAKGRMGKKLIMLYPDGSRSETFERTISIRKSF